MISAWLLLLVAALELFVALFLRGKSNRLREREYELDCRHLALLAAERIHNENAAALAAHVRFQMQSGKGRVEVA